MPVAADIIQLLTGWYLFFDRNVLSVQMAVMLCMRHLHIVL